MKTRFDGKIWIMAYGVAIEVNFDNVTREEVMAAERWVNNYPRKILGWKSAAMLFDQELQAA